MSKRYNLYHKHTYYSNIYLVDSNTSIEEYCKRAKELGHNTIFSCEHGYGGDVHAYKQYADQYGLKLIFSMEGYIVKDHFNNDKSNYHIVIIAKTDVARKKLNLLISDANMNGYYHRPRINLNTLLTFDKNDIYITTACVSGILKDKQSFEEIFMPLYKKFKDNILLEVQCHNDETQKRINLKALQLSKKLGIKLIASNDSHYIYPTESLERNIVLRGKRKKYDNEDSFILDYPSREEWIERFRAQMILSDDEIEEAINNTLLFDNCEEVKIDKYIRMLL